MGSPADAATRSPVSPLKAAFWAGWRGVDAPVIGRTETGGRISAVAPWIPAGDGGDFGGEQARDDAVMSVVVHTVPSWRRKLTGAFLAAETEAAGEQAGENHLNPTGPQQRPGPGSPPPGRIRPLDTRGLADGAPVGHRGRWPSR